MPFVLVICFIASGATSRILQVVWVRQLTVVFGVSSMAVATVLATFMAGLAGGSAIGGRIADRMSGTRPWQRPMFFYGVCEAIIAISALLIPTLIESYRGINAWLWLRLGDWPALLAGVRFFLSALLLAIPTTAMGATLPLLARQVTRHAEDFGLLGRRIGALYAANTTGAVLGAGAAGF